MSQPSQTNSPRIRVVSLSPGITATIVALGAGERVVGRTQWCQLPTEVPIVGSLLDLNAEMLVRVDPTILLIQPAKQGDVPTLDQLVSRHGWRMEHFRIDSIEDVNSMLARLPEFVADPQIVGDAEHLESRSRELRLELARAMEKVPGADAAGRVLVLLVTPEGADMLGFGTDTYLSDVLERIGCVNALARSGYPALGAEDLARIAPNTVILIGKRSAELVERIVQLAPEAMVVPVDSPELLQPGGGMIPGIVKFREAISNAVNRRTRVSDGGVR